MSELQDLTFDNAGPLKIRLLGPSLEAAIIGQAAQMAVVGNILPSIGPPLNGDVISRPAAASSTFGGYRT